MKKETITRTWWAGLAVLAGGLLVAALSVAGMLAFGGHFVPAPNGEGYDFVPNLDVFFWTAVPLLVLGGIAAIVGGIVQLVAWIGALINTNYLADKTWFIGLLLGGLAGFIFAPVGLAVMVAYVIAGPDGMAVRPPTSTTAGGVQPATLLPTS